MNRRTATALVSWILALWIVKVFVTSLPYKFSGHPDTQHIFSTIGAWLGELVDPALGALFSRHGAVVVGSFELLTSLVLLAPALVWLLQRLGVEALPERSRWHAIGGAMAALVMTGAVFFHLVSPLGVEVLHQGKPDGGALFYAAVSIVVSGIILFILNWKPSPGRRAPHSAA